LSGPSKTKALWQGRRLRGRLNATKARGEAVSPAAPSWQVFEFGTEHSPLAPPPSGGYTKGGGGVAGAGTAERTALHLSRDELLWLDTYGVETNRLFVLERVQAWDALITRTLHGLGVHALKRPKKVSMQQSELWSESTKWSAKGLKTRRRSQPSTSKSSRKSRTP